MAALSARPQYVCCSKAKRHDSMPKDNFEYCIAEFSQRTVRTHASDTMVLYALAFLIGEFYLSSYTQSLNPY